MRAPQKKVVEKKAAPKDFFAMVVEKDAMEVDSDDEVIMPASVRLPLAWTSAFF